MRRFRTLVARVRCLLACLSLSPLRMLARACSRTHLPCLCGLQLACLHFEDVVLAHPFIELGITQLLSSSHSILARKPVDICTWPTRTRPQPRQTLSFTFAVLTLATRMTLKALPPSRRHLQSPICLPSYALDGLRADRRSLLRSGSFLFEHAWRFSV
jgi:hypothetical protein